MKKLIPASILGVALLIAQGCRSPQSFEEELAITKTEFSKVSLLQVQEMVKDFGDRFAFSIKAAANKIVQQSPELEVRKRTVYWKVITIPNLRQSIYQEAPLVGLVDSWAFCVQMVDFFESGEGKEAFGDATHIALTAARSLESDIQQVAAKAIEDEYFKDWQDSIEKFARENPITSLDGRYSTRPALIQASESGKLDWLTALPLAPFRAFMSDTAKAIAEFSMVADRFADQLRFMPDDLLWNMQLILYDIEQRDTTRTALTNVELAASSLDSASEAVKEMATTAQEMAATAKGLPAEVESRVKSVLDEFDAKQEGIQGTLQEARLAVADVERTVVKADEFSQTAARVMNDMTTAGEKWESAVLAFHEVVKDLSPEEEAETETVRAATEEADGFDIKDYERTAEKTQEAVAELRSLTAEVRAFVDSGGTDALVKQIVLYMILFVAAFFGCLLAYRIAASRLAGKTTS